MNIEILSEQITRINKKINKICQENDILNNNGRKRPQFDITMHLLGYLNDNEKIIDDVIEYYHIIHHKDKDDVYMFMTDELAQLNIKLDNKGIKPIDIITVILDHEDNYKQKLGRPN